MNIINRPKRSGKIKAVHEYAPSYSRRDFAITMLEEGRLFKYILVLVIIASTGLSALPYFSFNDEKITPDSDISRMIYQVRKVSSIPDKKDEKISTEDENRGEEGSVTEEDLKRRYFSYVVSKIEKNRVYPPEEIRRGNEGLVVLKIPINRDGTTGRLSVQRSSRYARLTEAAIKAVEKSAPFPPYPSGISEDTLILQLNMDFRIDGY